MRCHSAAPRLLWPQGVVLAVVVAFMLHPTLLFAAAHQLAGGADENHFVVFPGKATWGPSPLAGGSLAAGTGSPSSKVLSLIRPKDAKVVATSVAMDEVKIGFPPLATETQQLPRPQTRPQPRPQPLPAPTGYTVGTSRFSAGPLVMLRGGIRGDSPFVLTRSKNARSRVLLGTVTKRLN